MNKNLRRKSNVYSSFNEERMRNRIEAELTAVWIDLLGVEQVGRHDSFFELGGRSLLAVRLISRLQQSLQIELPLASVFAKPVLAELAQVIIDELNRSGPQITPRIAPVPRNVPLSLSFAQQRLWFLAQLDPEISTSYHIPLALRLRGPLNIQAWRMSLNQLYARHESLRSVFGTVDGQPSVRLLPPETGMPIIERDLQHHSEAQTLLEEFCREEATTPFDLARGPLVRACIIRMTDHEHVFLITKHHIVSDGWSMGVAIRELSSLYRAALTGQDVNLSPLAIHYPDYAAWQRQWLAGERLQVQVEYWRQALEGAPTLLDLPTDRPRPPKQSFAGAFLPLQLDLELSQGLTRRSRQHGVTLFMTLLAAWATVLSRLSGQEDLIIGIPTANRGRRETEDLIGFFVNTLAVRVDVSGNPSVAELLQRVRGTALAAQEHQDLPFEQVVEIVQPPRRLDRTPLFQVMFTWQNNESSTLELLGLSVEPMRIGVKQVKFELELNLTEVNGRIVGGLSYATALFDQATIVRHREYLLAVLQAIATDENQVVSHIDLLSLNESELVLKTWNMTKQAYPDERCICELFEDQVILTPEIIALIHEHVHLSYHELNARANQLAHYLVELGVGPESIVGLCLDRGPDLVISLLAILKAGGAYLPLDPTYPNQRLIFILNDAQPKIILCDSVGSKALGAIPTQMECIEVCKSPKSWDALPVSNLNAVDRSLSSRNLAYVIYTSGSTGRPKGVMIEHRGLLNVIKAISDQISLTPGDRMLAITSIGFDIAALEIFVPILNGISLVIPPGSAIKDPLRLADLVIKNQCNIIQATPSFWKNIYNRLFVLKNKLRILVGGEELPPALAASLCDLSCDVFNLYGPTETTIWSTFSRISPTDTLPSIGRPIANTSMYILDRFGKPVPIGATGELYIGGAGVARGYLNRPELTAERFLKDPFSCEPDARMYRTGDLGRYRSDGDVEFIGRTDRQIKIRGFRIELGEIEKRLCEHPAIEQAVILVRKDQYDENELVTYVTLNSKSAGSLSQFNLPGELRTHLNSRLPNYMIPAVYICLEVLPLTANGKLDWHALPSIGVETYARQVYVPPQNRIEAELTAVWIDLLGVEQVGRHDSFFELGGHSLLAVRLISRLQQSLQIELPLASVFAKPVLAELAQVIIDELNRSGPQITPRIAPVPRNVPLSLSFAQQRLWFLAQLDPEISTSYHIPLALRLRGPLNIQAWRMSLNQLYARHESLRSVFGTVDGQPSVRLLPPETGMPIIERDLQHHSEAQTLLEEFCREEATTPFDLARGPLVRACIIRMTDHEHVFLITKHHIVSDGWSMGVAIRELSSLYRAALTGQDVNLSPLAIHYPDYAAWQRQWLAGERLQVQVEYWRQALEGAPTLLDLPTDRPRPPKQSFAGAFLPLQLDLELSQGLTRRSRQHGVTLFMTLLAAWATVLSRLSGQEDLIIGIPTANRGRRETEDLIGFFVNTLAVRVDVSGNPSVAELLQRVRGTALAAQEHQDLPFEQVVEIVQPPRRLDRTPLFQVMFTWQNNESSTLELLGLSVEPMRIGVKQVKFELELNLTEVNGRIVGGLSYATALFDQATIVRHREYLLAVLQAIATDENQ